MARITPASIEFQEAVARSTRDIINGPVPSLPLQESMIIGALPGGLPPRILSGKQMSPYYAANRTVYPLTWRIPPVGDSTNPADIFKAQTSIDRP